MPFWPGGYGVQHNSNRSGFGALGNSDMVSMGDELITQGTSIPDKLQTIGGASGVKVLKMTGPGFEPGASPFHEGCSNH